ncbi:hypothetical protein B0H15DRAFT_855995 [Mycena belliarum]|uniref:Uncharacterized protein n=1 Tax=Mycena belliarum TaxID=1033014 RepID=A0AAD6TXE0_9AGAR|nr:hypothetical protein B0H15DRAFT_855995 [Mycena belliae]
MSSRAASGRKRVWPMPTGAAAPAPQTTTSNKPSRPGIDPNVQATTFPTPVSPMHLRSASFSSPSSPSSSYAGLYPPTPSRDLIPRSQRSADVLGGLTPYPLPPQTQPPVRREKSINATPDRETPHPAPSYTALSVHFSDSERGESRRSSTSRALPPYPSSPPGSTGWAALSDTKVASATARPPSYLSELQPSPPLKSSFDPAPGGVARSGSVASTSRLSPTPTQPPYYSPPSSPRQATSRSRSSYPPALSSPPLVPTYSPAPYPTPQSSADSVSAYSPSTSPVHLVARPETSRSGSSDSISGSGGSGSASISTRSSDPHSPPDSNAPFVFPSSRSCARPGAGPGFKFRGRRKLKPAVQVLPAGTPIPAEGVFTAEAPPQPELPRRARSRPPPIVSTGGPPPFYFPSEIARCRENQVVLFVSVPNEIP